MVCDFVISLSLGRRGRGGEREGSSLCGTPENNFQNMRSASSEVMILRLQHHQDGQFPTYIDTDF